MVLGGRRAVVQHNTWHLETGLLEPLPIGAANFRERLDGLLVAMGADILGRVIGDKMEEDRCSSLQQASHLNSATCCLFQFVVSCNVMVISAGMCVCKLWHDARVVFQVASEI